MVELSLLQDFTTEATEHLEEMEASLLALEKDPDSNEVLNDIFRSIHTIKGAAQFVGLEKISELSHKVENLLDLLRKGEKELTPAITDILIDTKDRLAQLTLELEENQEEISEVADLLSSIALLSEDDQGTIDEMGGEIGQEIEDGAILVDDLQAALDQSILDDVPDDESSLSFEPVDDDLIEEEISGEAFDEELFEIFLSQVKSNFKTVQTLVQEFADSDDKENVISQLLDCLGKLRVSANYMGYVYLTRFYDNWLQHLKSVEQSSTVGERASLDFMGVYIEQIFRVLPQVDGLEPESLVPGEEEADLGLDISVLDEVGPVEDGEDSEPQASKEIDDDLVKKEISGEVYDDELFQIFINQVNTNLADLDKSVQEFTASENKSEVLENCLKSIGNLKSSANYMEYDLLVDLYENMRLEVEAACDKYGGDQEVDIDFISPYIERLLRIIPGGQLKSDQDGQEVRESFSEEDTADEQRQGLLDSLDTSVLDETGEDDLFTTLSSSVDASISETLVSDPEPFSNIIGEMLFADDDDKDDTAETEQFKGDHKDEDVTLSQSKSPVSVVDEAITTEEDVESINKQVENLKSQARSSDEAVADRRKVERRSGDRRTGDDGSRAFKQSIRVDSNKIDALMNQVGELVVSRAYFSQIFNDIREVQQALKEQGIGQKSQKPIRELAFKLGEANLALSRVSNELQEGVMKVRMLPVAQLFNRYPRLVRDLTHKTDKQVEIVMHGEETELDKMVIEEISDPLIHIIRNAVDHGIETNKERLAAGKPKNGTLKLEAYHESNHIVIEISDDGRGIDIDRVKEKAVENGLISQEEVARISDAEARRFIMMPGFSTADVATETSGRGVGMDVIKTNIEKLNGTVEIDSQLGTHTLIRIKIPLTLAIIQALMVKVGGDLFTVSLSVVEETLRVFEHEVSVIEGVEVIHLRDTTMPIFRLADIFNLPESKKQDISKSFVIIVSTGMQRVGLVVDELVGQEEVVIKPLVDYLRGDTGFSGATIIGDGRISLILDVYELVKMTSDRQIERYKKVGVLGQDTMGEQTSVEAPS